MSARRATALVHGLGPDSALFRAVNPELARWSEEKELLAINAEVTDALHRSYIRAHSDKHDPQPKPIKITRPHRIKEERRGTSLDELGQMFTLKPKE